MSEPANIVIFFLVNMSLLCNEMKYFILDSFELEIDYYFNFYFSLHFNITGQCIAISYPSVPTIMLQTKIVIINLFHACLVKIKINK